MSGASGEIPGPSGPRGLPAELQAEAEGEIAEVVGGRGVGSSHGPPQVVGAIWSASGARAMVDLKA